MPRLGTTGPSGQGRRRLSCANRSGNCRSCLAPAAADDPAFMALPLGADRPSARVRNLHSRRGSASWPIFGPRQTRAQTENDVSCSAKRDLSACHRNPGQSAPGPRPRRPLRRPYGNRRRRSGVHGFATLGVDRPPARVRNLHSRSGSASWPKPRPRQTRAQTENDVRRSAKRYLSACHRNTGKE